MGDVLLTTSVLRMLKTRFPSARIDYLVKEAYAPLLRTNPRIGQVIPVLKGDFQEMREILRRIRGERYDLLIDWQMNFRSRFIRFFSDAGRTIVYPARRFKRFLLVHCRINRYKREMPVPLRFLESVDSLGVKDDGLGLELNVEEKDVLSVASTLYAGGSGKSQKLIVLAPGAGRATKRWPHERFAEVGDYFNRTGYTVALTGGEKDREVCSRVENSMKGKVRNMAGAFSLMQTAALIDKSLLLITNDTGVMHIAAALKKPVIAIFGPTTRHFGFFPFRTRSKVVESDLECRPCSYHGTDECPRKHFMCMLRVKSDEVIQAAVELIQRACA